MKSGMSDTQVLDIPDSARVIQGGWLNVHKHVVCEAWRDSHFQFIHREIYGFEFPKMTANPSCITACPKCQSPLTDLWHGVWLCPDSQWFWDEALTYIDLNWRITLPIVVVPLYATAWCCVGGRRNCDSDLDSYHFTACQMVSFLEMARTSSTGLGYDGVPAQVETLPWQSLYGKA